MEQTNQGVGAHSKATFFYLLLTALICGSAVMVVEVLGSRVVGPFFGVSLFVWTSLISVTLLALAAGYGFGGWLADRRGTTDMLFALILAAGLLTLLIPWLKAPILKACVPLGLRGGAFVSTLLLFGPVLFLLGCVSPYLVKIATREMHHIGKTVGGLYAVSTAGSVIGTILTGFVLIAYVGVDRIFHIVGAVLILLAVGYFAAFRGKLTALAGLLLPLLVPQSEGFTSAVMANGTRVTLVAAEDSFYGTVKVMEYSYGERRLRELVIDGLVQGGIDPASGLSVYTYPYLLQFMPLKLNPHGRDCLVLGLGAGLIPTWYAEHGIDTDVVDIDPIVEDFAKRYFHYPAHAKTIIADARHYLSTTHERYDFIVLDVFNGDVTPAHLLSVEALRSLHKLMRPGAVLAINLVGSLRRQPYMTWSVLRTVAAVFDQVEVYPAFNPAAEEGVGNMAVVAYDGPVRQRDARLDPAEVHVDVRSRLRHSMANPIRGDFSRQGILLTDDYNPIDFYDAWLKESVRWSILDSTEWDALIMSGQ